MNGLRNVAGVLMNTGQIAMRIRKGRIDLDGTCITLKSSVDIAHLFQGVAHVGIGIGEGG